MFVCRVVGYMLVLCFWSTLLFAQRPKSATDSLIAIINTDKRDAKHLNALQELARVYIKLQKKDNAILAIEEFIEIVQSQGNETFESQGFEQLAYIYKISGENEQAIQYYNQALDITRQLLKNTKQNAYRHRVAHILSELSNLNVNVGNFDHALDHAVEAQHEYEKLEDQQGLLLAKNNIGVVYQHFGYYDKALQNYQDALKNGLLRNDTLGLAITYDNLGNYYLNTDRLDTSLVLLKQAMQQWLLIRNEATRMAATLNHTGDVLRAMRQPYKALDYYQRAVMIADSINDKNLSVVTYNNLGNTYKELNMPYLAMGYFKISVKMATDVNLARYIVEGAKSLSEIYARMKNYEQAFHYQRTYIQLQDSIDNKNVTRQIAEIESRLKAQQQDNKIRQQLIFINVGLVIAGIIAVLALFLFRSNRTIKKQHQTVLYQNRIIESSNEELQQRQEEIEKQWEELEKLSIVASSTDNAVVIISSDGRFEWINRSFIEMFGYTLDEIQELGEDAFAKEIQSDFRRHLETCRNEMRSVVYNTQHQTKWGEIIWTQTTLTPVIEIDNTISKFIGIDTNITQSKLAEDQIRLQRDEILAQRDQIAHQAHELMEQKKEMTDSIMYAGRIQAAMMPLPIYVNAVFNDHFIINRPRDIVSGDFFWVTYKDGKTVALVADCTGHGVPGAFMSMLGITILKTIFSKLDKITADEILNQLRDRVIRSLHQRGKVGEAQDGMDVAVIVIDQKTLKMQYAGANNPILLVRQKTAQNPPLETPDNCKELQNDDYKMVEFKPDKMPIGIYHSDDKLFSRYEIQLCYNDRIYLFSDGYIDQFGGEKGGKMMIRRFKEFLLSIQHLTMNEQQELIENYFDTWKGSLDQVDDIMIMGIKV